MDVDDKCSSYRHEQHNLLLANALPRAAARSNDATVRHTAFRCLLTVFLHCLSLSPSTAFHRGSAAPNAGCSCSANLRGARCSCRPFNRCRRQDRKERQAAFLCLEQCLSCFKTPPPEANRGGHLPTSPWPFRNSALTFCGSPSNTCDPPAQVKTAVHTAAQYSRHRRLLAGVGGGCGSTRALGPGRVAEPWHSRRRQAQSMQQH